MIRDWLSVAGESLSLLLVVILMVCMLLFVGMLIYGLGLAVLNTPPEVCKMVCDLPDLVGAGSGC